MDLLPPPLPTAIVFPPHRSVSKVVTTAEQPMLVALFRGLPQLPAVPRLQYTAALTLGAYAEWMAMALDQGSLQDLVPQLLQMLTSGLCFVSALPQLFG